jgi:hypothetical protein
MAGTNPDIKGKMKGLHLTQKNMMLRAGIISIEALIYSADNLNLKSG